MVDDRLVAYDILQPCILKVCGPHTSLPELPQ